MSTEKKRKTKNTSIFLNRKNKNVERFVCSFTHLHDKNIAGEMLKNMISYLLVLYLIYFIALYHSQKTHTCTVGQNFRNFQYFLHNIEETIACSFSALNLLGNQPTYARTLCCLVFTQKFQLFFMFRHLLMPRGKNCLMSGCTLQIIGLGVGVLMCCMCVHFLIGVSQIAVNIYFFLFSVVSMSNYTDLLFW